MSKEEDRWIDSKLAQAFWPAPPPHLKNKIMMAIETPLLPSIFGLSSRLAQAVLFISAILLGFAAGSMINPSSANSGMTSVWPYTSAGTLITEVFKA